MRSVINAFKQSVPHPLKGHIKRIMGVALTRLHPDWEILRPLGPVAGRHIVVDIGAATGWFSHCWKDWCTGAEVHLLSPARKHANRQRHFMEPTRPPAELRCCW
jgi:hypothetical protein